MLAKNCIAQNYLAFLKIETIIVWVIFKDFQ